MCLCVCVCEATHCLGDAPHIQASKARLGWAAGALFVLAGLVYLVPVCWTAYSVVRDFYDPGVAAALKRELGPALYLGWGAGVLLLVGGALLSAGSAPPPAPGGGRKGVSPKGAGGEEVKQPEKSFV